ncbi:DUF4011 domain-containing protein [Limimaricola pyoseonensis]|uniref:AAA domain-containing protein n=1 Tax=Limimaricola pyoseonensis TaxID=521013 RepID=A0A1G7KEL6_9RHOB|nr:DUF4011 domain-containing protein [Limimaricola pyoseonensis]SDF35566.1 Protein of unknown function [Limimaricola pyoseonensis]
MTNPAPPHPAPALAARAEIEIDASRRIGAASLQGGVRLLRALGVTATGTAPIEAAGLRLSAEPAVIAPREWEIGPLEPGETRRLTDLGLALDPGLLHDPEAAGPVRLSAELVAEGRVVARAVHVMTLLAPDHWGGMGEMAHLLPAFARPGDPAVADLLETASRLLAGAGRGPALGGGAPRDPAAAFEAAAAIWSAAGGWGLACTPLSPRFAIEGQRLPAPAALRAAGAATALDLSVLLAAAFEAAGLPALVFVAQDRPWVGLRLLPGSGALVETDAVALRRAVAAREVLALDPALLGRRPAAGFAEARAAGRALLDEDREPDFIAAIDVAQARAAGIAPLAGEAAEGEGASPGAPAPLPEPPGPADLPIVAPEPDAATPEGRLERWQRRLLDLSLRNRLLNFREGRSALPLDCPDIAGLEDRLAAGSTVVPVALGTEETPPDAARAAQARGRIAVPLAETEMRARLVRLWRRARADLQEGGANTLFLAAGLLRWRREGESGTHLAPVLLIPVRLERRAAREEFRLAQHEDGPVVNATLLELLSRDFGIRVPGLSGELQRDESGIDLPRVFDLIRAALGGRPGFELVESLSLSTFSFAKFLMWKDLAARGESLRESPLVGRLLDGAAQAEAGDPPLAPRDLDTRLAPGDLVTPLPADSSQLAAVAAAGQGRDFVLIGPPGTGKSQTIANIVAQCLSQGRTVLFVAEKAAALEVVHRRLAAHGLAEACLALHSSRAERGAVLAQLGRAWNRAAPGSARDWGRTNAALAESRDALNAYAAALHRPGAQGFSVFDAIGRIADGAPGLRLSFAGPDAHDTESYARLRDLSAELGRLHAIAPRGPAASLIAARDWSFAWQEGFLDAAAALADALEAQAATLSAARAALGAGPGTEPQALADLAALAAAPDPLPDRPLAELRDLRADLEAAAALMRGARARLSAQYPVDRVEEIPLDALDQGWQAAQESFWPGSVLAARKIRARLQRHATSGEADPETDLAALRRLRAARARLAANPLVPDAALPGEADLAALDAALERRAGLEAALDRLGLERGVLPAGQEALRGLAQAEAALAPARDAFTAAGGALPARAAPETLARALRGLCDRPAAIADRTRWNAARAQARAVGLAPLVEALEAERLDRPAEDAFAAAYAAWWLPRAMDADPVLRDFAHWAQEDLIARFADLDARAQALASGEVLRRIAGELPARDAAPRDSELGVLRHQLSLRRPSLPIRQLLSQIPDTLPRLAPCVLMSPLSVAQYLPPDHPGFDVVIFDEASQITTWDAIGAIARGRQAIVVGDPKQLPPTDFFGRAEPGEEEDDSPDALRDLPSILDEAVAAGLPVRRLDWHYRSRDEALIAFSNHMYYDGGLVTFPSPGGRGEALRLHRVEGRYGRGRARTNPDEARAVVAHLRARLAEWTGLPEDARPSLGVITFNGEQQALILDLIDAMRRDAPELEWAFDEAREEPVIVKNLENIQGDERDVILFSVTYGPDAEGRLSMNFGALNGEGGERRLNVAITRARREMHVFASLDPSDIDIARTRARGVADLKAFLDYADRGAAALPARDKGSLGPAESPFEAAVADALESLGWEVRTQVGVSGFRIDLAVVDPDRAGAYLAGVECDGARYHSAATARDRDRLRQQVLEGLGWTILRIWSTDWFRSPREVLERIDRDLAATLAAARARRAAERPAPRALPAPGVDPGGTRP